MYRKRAIFLCLALFVFVSGPLAADTIILSNGVALTGEIVAATPESITIQAGEKKLTYSLSEIKSINGRPVAYQSPLSQAQRDQQAYANALTRGQEFLQSNQHLQAIAEFEKALAINSTHVSAYSGIAAAYLNLQQYSKAVEYASAGIDNDKDFPNIYGIRAQAYLNFNNIEAAESDLSKAKDLLENPAKYQANEALLEYVNSLLNAIRSQRAAQREAARAQVESTGATVASDGQYWQHVDQGQAYARMGQFLNAINEYQSALLVNPASDQAYVYLGQAYESIQRDEQAKQAYEKAININPGSKQAYYDLAILYNRKFRDNQKALEYFKNAIDIDPEFAEAHHNLGMLFSLLGDQVQARSHLRRAGEIFSKRGSLQDVQAVESQLNKMMRTGSLQGAKQGKGFLTARNIFIAIIIILSIACLLFAVSRKRQRSI